MRIEVGFNERNERVGTVEIIERRKPTPMMSQSAAHLRPTEKQLITNDSPTDYKPKYIHKLLDERLSRPVVIPP